MPSSAVRIFVDFDAYHAAFRDMQAESVITGRGVFAPNSPPSGSTARLFSAALLAALPPLSAALAHEIRWPICKWTRSCPVITR